MKKEQDRNSPAWKELCSYIDILARNGKDEFTPREALGDELFENIYTLPESISKLKKVKKVGLYGSNINIIPPEIGEMESLEYFDPYTSYDLHWLPYEITKCKKLKSSRISTRALYGNYKFRAQFPSLENRTIKYHNKETNCSLCNNDIDYNSINQFWISLEIGTDTVPLLVNLCSDSCKTELPTPPKAYVQYAHKGGPELEQPTYEDWENNCLANSQVNLNDIKQTKGENGLIKLVRKIWNK